MPNPNRQKVCRRACAAIAFSVFAAAARANSYTWTGLGNDNIWTDQTNWSPNGAPGSTDDTFFSINATESATGTTRNLTNSGSIGFLGNLNVYGTNVANAGTIELGASSGLYNRGSGTVTFTGGGTVILSGASATVQGASASAEWVNVNNTFTGTGTISLFQNGGTIAANAGTLTVSSVTNTGMMLAPSGGTLAIANTIQNSSGTISAQNGGLVIGVGRPTVYGGTFTTQGTGEIVLPSSTATIENSFFNSGNMVVTAANFDLATNAITNTTITGGGTITLANQALMLIPEGSSASTLINVDNYIQGEGFIQNEGRTFLNEGTIAANISGGYLYFDQQANSGTLEAANGGILTVNTTLNSGTLVALNGSSVCVEKINGGTLATVGSGTICPYTFMPTNMSITGSITNLGNLNTGTSTNIVFNFTSPGSVNGGGTITLAGGELITEASNVTNVDNLICGSGVLLVQSADFINDGTISASTNQGEIYLESSVANAISNNGVLSASNGGTLNIVSPIQNNGTISVTAGSTIVLSANAFTGGTLVGTGAVSGMLNLGGITVGPGSAAHQPGTLIFTAGTQTLGSGGTYVWETSSLPGATPDATAGSTSDFLKFNNLSVSATASNPYTIKLISLTSSGQPGAIAGAQPGTPYTFAIASFNSTDGTFNPSAFAIDTSSFPNLAADGATISLDSANDEIYVTLVFTPEPSAISWFVGPASMIVLARRRHRVARLVIE